VFFFFYFWSRAAVSQDLYTGHERTGEVRMNGLSLQCSENASGVRSERRVMAFVDGILVVYG